MTERFSPILPSNLEIVHAALKNRLVLVAGDILVQVLAAALRMAHLAEDTAIRAGDALDGEDGAVGVVLHVHAGAAVLIDVLGRDLAVGDEGVQHALRCHEAALTVADGHIVFDFTKVDFMDSAGIGLIMGRYKKVMDNAQLSAAHPASGDGWEMNAIAATVLGGTSMSGGSGTIIGTVVGAFVIGVINDGMTMCGVSEFWQKVIRGLVIILAVVIDQTQRNLQAKMALQARNENK